MKVTDTSWRAVIGAKAPKTTSRQFTIDPFDVSIQLFTAVMITTLLLISGIEMNPGPNSTNPEPNAKYKSTTYNDVHGNMDSSITQHNPQYMNSVWGALSTKLYGTNTPFERKFLSQLHGLLRPNQVHKFGNITPDSVSKALATIPNLNELSVNYIYSGSTWGEVAQRMFSDREVASRKYLSMLSKIYNQILHACQAEQEQNIQNIAPIPVYQIEAASSPQFRLYAEPFPNSSSQIYPEPGPNSQSRLYPDISEDLQGLRLYPDLSQQMTPLSIPQIDNHSSFEQHATDDSLEVHSTINQPNTSTNPCFIRRLRNTIQNKRKRNSAHYNLNREHIVNSLHELRSSRSASQIDNNSQTLITHELTELFQARIWQFATLACEVCSKLIYPANKMTSTVKDKIRIEFQNMGKTVSTGDRLVVCSRCYNNMSRGKLSPQSVCNSMNLPPIPIEIARLSLAEVRLISQVKLHMKVFLLTRGRGQQAMKGLAIHFPQQVNEVIQQLPLSTADSDFVIVAENFSGVEHIKEIRIRPHYVYEALNWLKINNKYYHNIGIVNRDLENIQRCTLSDIQQENIPQIPITSAFGFCTIYEDTEILYANLHQGHQIFMPNSGKQCSAMCATFLAHCSIQAPISWTNQTLNEILSCGNRYYAERIEELAALQPNNSAPISHLNPEEVAGTVKMCFNSLNVRVNPHTNLLLSLEGFLNRANLPHMPRLQEKIQEFLESDFEYALLNTSMYTMGIFRDSDHVYYYDSHSRGSKGGKAAVGKSCLLKYRIQHAAQKISFLVHLNCQSAAAQEPTLANMHSLYSFSITPMTCEHELENENLPILSDYEVSTDDEQEIHSPRRKKTKTSTPGHSTPLVIPVEVEVEDPNFQRTEIIQQLQIGNAVTDCVIDTEDFVEPHIDTILELHRTGGRPIITHLQKSLDLLAFPQLFPHGQNGLHEARRIPITTPDYFQQRLMSSDSRFSGNTDLLFYALSESDRYRVQQKISICCSRKNQEANHAGGHLDEVPPGVNDPHSYLSAIRGSASYWKKYTGDIIAMIKQIGIPTFFLTVSFDDLNSFDAVNAIWKAEYGSECETVVPNTIDFEERRRLLNKHPIAAARHFSMRITKLVQLLREHSDSIFGRPLLDYTLRIEFQARGSPHAHCLLWLSNPPDFMTDEGVTFIDRNVSCAIKPENKEIVLKYQNHRHSATCFKNKKNGCRFHFPRKEMEVTKVIPNDADINRNCGIFVQLQRSNTEVMINNYHPILLHILKCNMDIQPVTGAMAIAFYIAKYISKSEPATLRDEIQTSIQNIIQSNLPVQQKMNRVAMTIMRNREVSAQEAAFRMCHLFLRKSSTLCVFLPTFRKENRIRMVRKETICDDEPEFCLNIIDRYMLRPNALDDICLFEFAAHFAPHVTAQRPEQFDEDLIEFEQDLEVEVIGKKTIYTLKNGKGKVFKRSKPAIVKYPNFDPIKDRDAYLYSLILMYLPFREENFCDDQSPSTVFNLRSPEFRKNENDPIIKLGLAAEIDQALLRITEFNELENQNLDMEDGFQLSYVETMQVDDVASHDELFPTSPQNLVDTIKSMYQTLSAEQKNIFGLVDSRLKGNKEQLRLIVSGEGGTGKSYLIRLLSLLIRNVLTESSIVLSAPTGKAAFNIEGVTIHKAFALPVELGSIGNYQKLGGQKLTEMRRLYHNVEYIIIDELSMVNYECLRMIHRRLVEIFDCDELFGGKNVILLELLLDRPGVTPGPFDGYFRGDLMQLKPPRGSWIFKKPNKYGCEADLWRLCQFSELKVNFRQTGPDPLLSICSRLRVGKLELPDINVLQSRVLDPLRADYNEMFKEFQDCPWVFPKLKQVHRYNRIKTDALRTTTSVFKIESSDTYMDGNQVGRDVPSNMVFADENKCGGFLKVLELGIGSRVMLRRNKNVPKGLVNGALGTIVSLQWTFGHQTHEGELPLSVKVKFDHLQELEVIEPMSVDFYGKRQKKVCRRQLPFLVAFAINVHKVQGVTLDRVVIDLGKDLFAKGMAYVALSRVKTLNGLAICSLDPSKLLTTDKFTPCDTEALAELARLRAAHTV